MSTTACQRPKDHSDFAATLRHFRTRAGFSQNALGNIASINPSYVNRMEAGVRQAPTREVALSLARSLSLTARETDRLLFVAGHVPPTLQKLGGNDSTVAALLAVLTNDCIPPESRADFRAVVEVMCGTWLQTVPCRVAQPS